MERILVIYPSETESSVSVVEVSHYIKELYSNFNNTHEIEEIHVTKKTITKEYKKIIESDIIVVLDHSPETFLSLSHLRETMGCDFRVIFYVLGMASTGMWPLFKWNLGKCLNSSDLFIVSCSRDVKLIKKFVNGANILYQPFSISPYTQNIFHFPEVKKIQKLVYIGRLSSQKNIHSMIELIYILNNMGHRVELNLIGGWDEIGSPPFKMEKIEYQKEVQNLVLKLGIKEQIIFHGHKTKKEIDLFLSQDKYVFISLSLNIDENFNLSAFRALSNRTNAIVTDWGGQYDFSDIFYDNVELVELEQGLVGPFVNVHALAVKILKLSFPMKIYNVPNFTLTAQSIVLLSYLNSKIEKKSKIEVRNLLETMLRDRETFMDETGEKVYDGYMDNKYIEVSSIYSNAKVKKSNLGIKSIFVEKQEDDLILHDLMKGRSTICLKNKSEEEISKILKDLGHFYSY